MKKKNLYLLIGIIIILTGSYLLRYKTVYNISHRIPKDAVAVININIRQLEHHFLTDFISNPFIFFKDFYSKKKDTTNQYFSLFKDIDLPKNIIFYTKDTLFQTWISSEIKINSEKKLIRLLNSNDFNLEKKNKLLIYRKHKLFILLKSSNMYVGFTNNSSLNIIDSYINIKNYISKNAKLYKQLNNKKSDISFATINDEAINVSFKNGKIEVKGNYHFDILKDIKIINNDSSIANLYVSFNKSNKNFQKLINSINKNKFRKLTKINLDTLVKKWNGDLYFTLFNFKTKIDTIITYTYDDNFNKIENINIQEDISPNFNLNLGMQSNIITHLENSGALKLIENDSVFVSFPLTKTYISTSPKNLFFFTSYNKHRLSKQHNKLISSININSYKAQTDNTIFEYFNHLNFIKDVTINISSNDKIEILININNKRNAFVNIIKNID